MERKSSRFVAGGVFAVMFAVGLPVSGLGQGRGFGSATGGNSSADFLHNLIVNGGAENSVGSDGTTAGGAIPGWTVTGAPRVISYESGYDLTAGGIVPANHMNNYFAGGLANTASTMAQTIDVSGSAASIDLGTVIYDLSGYLGGRGTNTSTLTITFLGATGNILPSVTLGPLSTADKAANSALYFRRQIGVVPVGARTVSVVVKFNPGASGANDGYADALELTMNAPGAAGTVILTNLIANAGAEAAAAGTYTSTAGDVPNWVRTAYFNTDSYGDAAGDLATSALTPPKAGSNYFWGGVNNPISSAYQDIDVSAAAGLIDSGSVNYQLMAWLGGVSSERDNAIVTADFRKWDGTTLRTVRLGPVSPADRNYQSGLLQIVQNGQTPAGTRMVRITTTMTRMDGANNDGLADNLSLVLVSSGVSALPSINPDGVISGSEFGGFPAIAPGTWMEIYGTNLAAVTGGWTASDFVDGHTAPTELNGVSVSVGGKAAYVSYTSAGQVNAQVPEVAAGPQPVVVSNASGASESYTATVNAIQPGLLAPASFVVDGKQYVSAQFADGTYALPAGTVLGLPTRAAHPGETVVIYGIGFGPVTPDTPPGQMATGLTQITALLGVQIGGATAQVNYEGMAPTYVGLYQFNVVVPNIAANAFAPVVFTVNGVAVGQQLYLAVGP